MLMHLPSGTDSEEVTVRDHRIYTSPARIMDRGNHRSAKRGLPRLSLSNQRNGAEMFPIFTEEPPHSKNALTQYRVCNHIERDSQTAPPPLIPQHTPRFQQIYRRFIAPSHFQSILFEQSYPFTPGQWLHSHMYLFRHCRLNLVAHVVRNIVRQEAQLVDSVPSSGSEKTPGFGKDPAFLSRTLHAQHCLAINHASASAGQP